MLILWFPSIAASVTPQSWLSQGIALGSQGGENRIPECADSLQNGIAAKFDTFESFDHFFRPYGSRTHSSYNGST